MASAAKAGQRPPVHAGTHNDRSGKRQIAWTLFASAAAGLSTYYYSLTTGPASITSLPASYALCADSNRVYTVDHAKPHVECILVDKTIVSATGSLGQSVRAWVQSYVSDRTDIRTRTAEIQSYWDEYQNELIRKFYGNEPSAKKPLPVYNVPVGSIVVPGLTGRTSL